MQIIGVLQGFENILEPQHVGDAGYDLVAASDPEIVGIQRADGTWSAIHYIEYDTEVILAPKEHENSFCLVFPRSSISKTNLVMANSAGVIDGGYRGHIKVRFKYVLQPYNLEVTNHTIRIGFIDGIYQKGDRIAQAIFFKKQDTILVDGPIDGDYSTRGSGGFGSTGK